MNQPLNVPKLKPATGYRPWKHLRWWVLAVLFLSGIVNYVDRNVLSFTMIDPSFKRDMLGLPADAVLTPALDGQFKEQMGFVDAAFKAAYAVGFLLTGWLTTRLGLRRGFSLFVMIWSLAGMLTSLVGSIRSLALARAGLAVGEAGNFPAATRTVSEWFPQKERSIAFGIFNASGNIGIILTAWLVPFLTLQYGWRSCFLLTGLLGIGLLVAWLVIYRPLAEHPRLSPDEHALIRADEVPEPERASVSWWQLLRYRQTWAYAGCKFLIDPVFWIYLTWLPDFFNSSEALDQKLDLKNLGLPFLVIYLVTDVGSIFFGWLSSYFLKIGWSVNRARKTTWLICALCVLPIVLAAQTHSLWVAIGLISLATAAHQGFSATLFASVTDLFPKPLVAQVTGIGGAVGAISGVLLALVAGIIRVRYGYFPLFVVAACSYLLALGIIHLLVPKMERVVLAPD
ncbi:MFS transporter [Larkinella punicea]|uniref:MFS transporter n=1 Tax=Larkinella punicea TaxID=2315727 RepID=A0A368JFZ3_9BACT|nr:MFS transporter [Larkinella punicea]RCR66580.1 MFS transporter [Larkinella punicea]